MEPEPFDNQAVEAVAHAQGASLQDLTALPVEVEVRLLRGLLGTVRIIGLPDSALRESRERVRSAIRAVGMTFPERSLLVNLAPAELRKVGPGLDLAIAAGVLAVSGQVPAEALRERLLWGELGLDGRLRAVRGSIPVALLARSQGTRELVVPRGAEPEVAMVQGLAWRTVENLGDVVRLLQGEEVGRSHLDRRPSPPAVDAGAELWDSVVGQDEAKRALQVAMSGGHHILLTGPPGSGKSMLAKAAGGLLPELDEEAALEVSCIHSAAGLSARTDTRRPPFRAPHCSVTVAGLAGGGAIPRPGEITLAHRGILFLDELPHFRREVYDLLRAPLEDAALVLTRAGRSVRYPACFLLIAAMNPCPCGHAGELESACSCSPTRIRQYRARIAGPVLDRIDLSVRVPFVPADRRVASQVQWSAARVREQLQAVRERQRERNGGKLNSDLSPAELDQHVALDEASRDWLSVRIDRLRLSVRAHHRLLRVARTLADLEEQREVGVTQLLHALGYREPEAGSTV